MSRIVEEVVAANRTYANNFGEKGKLPLPPARGFVILTCMDARLDPAKYAAWRKAMHTLYATPAAERPTTPSAPW